MHAYMYLIRIYLSNLSIGFAGKEEYCEEECYLLQAILVPRISPYTYMCVCVCERERAREREREREKERERERERERESVNAIVGRH
jgi:hypothetical protein